MTALATKTILATDLAIQAAGYGAEATAGAVSTDDRLALSPDPWAEPASTSDGWPAASASTMLGVRFRVNPRTRIDYLVIDATNAPLTGNYSLDLGTGIATYDATAGAPADVAALLAAWAAEIVAVYGPAGSSAQLLATAEVVQFRTPGSGDSDAIRLTAIDPDNGTRGTYNVLANTIAPWDADLHVVREIEGATMQLLQRRDVGSAEGVVENLATSSLRSAWHAMQGGAVGVLPAAGWAERLDTGSISRLFARLSDPVLPSGDTLINVDAGSPNPRVTVLNSVLVDVAPAAQP